MNRLWTSVAALVVVVSLTASAQAGGKVHHAYRSGPSVHANQYSYSNLHGTYSNLHGNGYALRVNGTVSSKTWSYCYWDRRYSSYLYWNPTVSCYYYWCAPQTCYFPVSYCPYGTYCWAQPVNGTLPAPVTDVKTVSASAVATINVNGGMAPTPTPTPIP